MAIRMRAFKPRGLLADRNFADYRFARILECEVDRRIGEMRRADFADFAGFGAKGGERLDLPRRR